MYSKSLQKSIKQEYYKLHVEEYKYLVSKNHTNISASYLEYIKK